VCASVVVLVAWIVVALWVTLWTSRMPAALARSALKLVAIVPNVRHPVMERWMLRITVFVSVTLHLFPLSDQLEDEWFRIRLLRSNIDTESVVLHANPTDCVADDLREHRRFELLIEIAPQDTTF
jgi:hypothetical protein